MDQQQSSSMSAQRESTMYDGQGSAPRNSQRVQAASAPVVDTAASKLDLSSLTGSSKSKDEKKREWNTSCLPQRLGVDAACAAAAGGLVAPLITMIDKAIIENASGRRPMMTSFRASLSQFVFRPHHFLASKPFRLIFMLYGGTYLMANTLDTTKSTINNKQASATTSGPTKFAATSAANVSLCLYKDSQFTKMFGTVSTRPVPTPSYILFAARDSLTVFASFNLPPVLAPVLPISDEMQRYVSRASAAQFIAPAAVQLISTPMHLLGLDLYNRNGGTPFSERMRKVRVDWLKSSLARMCRIVPAFGFGGVVNTRLRKRMMAEFES